MDGPYEWVRTLGVVGSLLLSVLAMLVARHDRGSERNQKALEGLGKRISEVQKEIDAQLEHHAAQLARQESRLSAVDQTLRMIPQRPDLDQLQQSITAVMREVAEVRGEQQASLRLLDRINTHLMDRK